MTDKPGIPAVPPLDSPSLYALLQAMRQNIEYGDRLTAAQKATLTAQIEAVEQSLAAASQDLSNTINSVNSALNANIAGLNTVYMQPATSAEYRANAAGTSLKGLSPPSVWDAAAFVTLADAATIALDFNTGFNFAVTLGGNRTLGNPANAKPGQAGCIQVLASGAARTLAKGTNWRTEVKFPLTIAASRRVFIYYQVFTPTFIVITGVVTNPV